MSEGAENQRQNRITKLLEERDYRIANVYKGGVEVMKQDYPEKIPQSANSFREVIYMLTALDEIKKFGRIKRTKPKAKRKQDLIENLDPLHRISTAYVLHKRLTEEMLSWFASVAHHSRYPTEKEYFNKVAELEKLLEKILKPHFEVIDEIDKLLTKKPVEREEFGVMKTLLSRNTSAYNYFFQNASADWLPVLMKEKYFENPQHIVKNGDRHIFIRWTPAIYLWKSASQKPSEVSQIICSFTTPPEGDRNPWILNCFVKAALEMPPKYSKCIVNTIFKEKWIEAIHFHSFLAISISKLMKKIADNGFEKETICLAHALLYMELVEHDNSGVSTNDRKVVKPRVGDYWFENILNDSIQYIFEKFPKSVTRFCVKQVTTMIYLENAGKGEKESKMDQSWVWRRAIENSEKNHYNDFRSQLVGKLGDFLIELGRKSLPALRKILIEISRIEYPVFRRIELYVYWSFPEHFKSKINDAIKANFNDPKLQHEYFYLVKNCFQYASELTRKQYLEYVNNGPSAERIGLWKYQMKDPKLNIIEQKVKSWKVDKLMPIKTHLLQSEKERFKDLLKTNILTSDFIPLYNPELNEPKLKLNDNMRPDEVISFLRSYDVDRDIDPTYSNGTAQLFQEYVSREPKNYSSQALACLDLDAIFICGFLRGMEHAIKQKALIDWDSLLSLCEKITSLAKDNKIRDVYGTIYYVVTVLKLSINRDSINFEFRCRVWELLKNLVELGNDDPTYEEEYAKEDWDNLGLTNGTTDEQTFESIFEYIMWCEKHTTKGYFDTKAKNLITCYLEQNIIATRSRQAVLGYNLLTLYYFDQNWIGKRLDDLFENKNENLSRVAWYEYLAGNVYDEAFIDLSRRYLAHVATLKCLTLNNNELRDYDKRVIWHVTVAYLHNIAGSKEIFREMIERAHEKVLSHCAWVITAILRDQKENHNEAFNFDVFREVWNSSPLTSNSELLRWVHFSPLSKKETLEFLYNSLVKSSDPISSPLSFEEFIPYVNIYPHLTLECLELIIHNRLSDSDFIIVGDELKYILKVLLENDETNNSACTLVHFLGEHELDEYKILL